MMKHVLLLIMTVLLAAGCSLSGMELGESSSTPPSSQSSNQSSEQTTNEGSNQTSEDTANHSSSQTSQQPLTSFEDVANYIKEHGELPDNFITKKEAEKLGWVANQGNLHEVAPGKSIGGDRFGNREKLLPDKKGRIWYEADINYTSGYRGKDRIVFSNDGLIYKTEDHYESFEQIK